MGDQIDRVGRKFWPICRCKSTCIHRYIVAGEGICTPCKRAPASSPHSSSRRNRALGSYDVFVYRSMSRGLNKAWQHTVHRQRLFPRCVVEDNSVRFRRISFSFVLLLLSPTRIHGLDRHPIAFFRQDDARPHTPLVSVEYLRNAAVFLWTASFSDLSSIEAVWHQLEPQLRPGVDLQETLEDTPPSALYKQVVIAFRPAFAVANRPSTTFYFPRRTSAYRPLSHAPGSETALEGDDSSEFLNVCASSGSAHVPPSIPTAHPSTEPQSPLSQPFREIALRCYLSRCHSLMKPCNHYVSSRKSIAGRGGRAVSLLASHQGEQDSTPGRVTGFSHVGIVLDDAVGRRVFSVICRFPRPFIPALLHTHLKHPHRLSRPHC
ncbi:hypothetical protein PR048_010313 [Dryococelus australis]|uniref:Uncharacterized protein n=1 Tax=Dryococelus australis TaxID=614101 RepID=A0ABQ9I2D1_9NEOP|nr:hypothetical protein PR048_010313 [Dryococelus australis]